MASQWIRWNPTTHIYELSLDNGSSWSVLPLDGSILNEGIIDVARISGLTNTQIDAAAAISWSKISKVGSSLADLATRLISNLSDGANAALLNAQNIFTNVAGQVIDGLIDISAATAGQIKFPASQNASADANTLDDYEEGTFTPIDSSGAGLTFVGAIGTYIKIGRIVFLRLQLAPFPVNANANTTVIGGLPYASSTDINFLQIANVITSTSIIFGDVIASSTTLNLTFQAGGLVINSQISGVSIIVTGFYLTGN